MKILVTGSSGHLGEALCRTLKKKQIGCIGIDIKEGPYTTQIGSITDPSFVNQVVENIDYVVHTATLHKPHIVTHSKQDFIDTNITGTLNLLEAAKRKGVKGCIFTSTTSTFGDQLRPTKGEPAVWVTEDLTPIPKNIYGVTKLAAEDLCQLYVRNHQLPCLILKTSRFFSEADDNKQLRETYEDLNIKANEYLHRRVDIEDVVSAHLLAIEKVVDLGFQKYIISATSPFTKKDLLNLHTDATKVVSSIYPEFETLYKRKGWKMLPQIGRVYVNAKARNELGWQPKYDFQHILNCLEKDQDYRSALTLELGIKGYHTTKFEESPYPVIEKK